MNDFQFNNTLENESEIRLQTKKPIVPKPRDL